jgi:CRP-like cAMP-binding protein
MKHSMPDYDGRRGHNALVAKLSGFAPLSDSDVDVLEALCSKEKRVNAGVNLVGEGSTPRHGFVITRGLACRYRLMADGRRQILTLLIPGDFYDLHAFLLNVADHSVVTMAPTWLAKIEQDTVSEIVRHHPRIGAALWWSAMQEAALLRERIVALGRRNARARIAYLFCEVLWRHRAIGLSEDQSLQLPLTQADIADNPGADGGSCEPGVAEAATRGARHAGSPPAHAAQRRSAAAPRRAEPGLFASDGCASGGRTLLKAAGATGIGRSPHCRLTLTG